MGFVELTDSEFKAISKLVYDRFGINLTDAKRNLVNGRLQKILKKYALESFNDYYNTILNDKSGEYLSEFINHISTNHTYFYRENEHFNYFTKAVFPELVKNLSKRSVRDIRIWSAGCSSGEEPYMIVMLMMEFLGIDYNNWNAGILATDISEKALTFAKNGIYPIERTGALPKIYLTKYFTKLSSEEYEVNQRVKKEVTFRRLNLMNPEFPFRKQFHIIFCRNVMIYFDSPTRLELVNKFYNLLEPGGYLFIGHSETLSNLQTKFKYIMPALYRKYEN